MEKETCPKCDTTQFFIDFLQNEERRCRLCYTHWDKPIEATLTEANEDGYYPVLAEPPKYDDYLVKTKQGGYEFAHYNQQGWTVLGDNRGADVILWMEIPTTDAEF